MNCDKIHHLYSSLRANGSNMSHQDAHGFQNNYQEQTMTSDPSSSPSNNNLGSATILHRALPAIPGSSSNNSNAIINNFNISQQRLESQRYQEIKSTTSAMERLKDCGWYWGPLSKDCADKLLESEPNGSFLVRDSSSENHIFSVAFKIEDKINHTRIEHSQGNFSFGQQKFSSNTIVDFIERFIDHSQSGRLEFFLHRDPSRDGPVRLQLTNPVSRFKEIRSLKHMTRFTILRYVRRDHISLLPLPEPLKVYMSDPCYYSEIDQDDEEDDCLTWPKIVIR